MITIDQLIARCQRYTGVRFVIRLQRADAFDWADPGDAIELGECERGIPTGRRILALVLQREPKWRGLKP